jgi:hypothetical protein
VRHRQASFLLAALATAPNVHAETLYVIDQLVVSVNSAPDATGERVATLKSGDAVEVLDRQGDQVRVQLAIGTAGWVRKSYLSAEEPLQQRLTERAAEVDKLKQDVARLEGQLAAARAEAHGKPEGAQTNMSPGAPAPAPVEPSAAEPSYFMTPPETAAHPAWHWALGSFVIALGLGFALGWQVLDRRIRRKYGGLRIY